MALVIAIANQKNGEGKTTTTYNLAAALSRVGKMVLMIDIDPQYSLTERSTFVPDAPEFNGMSSCSLFSKCTDPLDCCFTIDAMKSTTLFIVPSNQDLELLASHRFTPNIDIGAFCSNIEKLKPYFDYIFLDCPSSLNDLLTASLVAADGVIIPVKPERLSFAGMHMILQTIDSIRTKPKGQTGNPDLKVFGLIATMFQAKNNEHREYKNMLAAKSNLLGVISHSSFLAKETGSSLPIVVEHPFSASAKEYERIALKCAIMDAV